MGKTADEQVTTFLTQQPSSLPQPHGLEAASFKFGKQRATALIGPFAAIRCCCSAAPLAPADLKLLVAVVVFPFFLTYSQQ